MKLLVIRLTAMGDVALVAPVLKALTKNYSNIEITFVTRDKYSSFFYSIPNVNVVGVNLKKYRGFVGIIRLFRELKQLGPYEKIIDLHASLRSKFVCFLFKFAKTPSFKIIKGRREKIKQTRRFRKILKKLPHTVDRYLKVFENANLKAPLLHGPWINVEPNAKIAANAFFDQLGLKIKKELWIGFAPFAGHKLKEWPYEKSEELIPLLNSEIGNCKVFLLGSEEELPIMRKFKKNYDFVYIVREKEMMVGVELGIMERMDLVIGMDSSNVHVAALMKKPVIGIYGTTHPYSGFAPFGQEDVGVLQVDLPCRPCSIYGNRKCFRGDFACMNQIEPVDVIKRVNVILNINTLW